MEIPAGFEWVLFTGALVCFHYFLQGGPVMGLRAKYFTKAFFETNFPDLPKDTISEHGYPDQGFGRYADKLPLDQWIRFANYQRCHVNYLENLPSILFLLMSSGLYSPRISVAAGIVYIIARQLYSMGYRSKSGANKRVPGSVLSMLTMFVLMGTTVYGMFVAGGGIAGLRKVLGV